MAKRKQSQNKVNTPQKMVVDLALKTTLLTRKDIGAWRRAWQQAINTERYNRMPLNNIYEDILIDGHLSGAIEQRKMMVKRKAFKIIDAKSGEEIKELKTVFDSKWFKDSIDYILDAPFYGHSLIQLGDPIEIDGVFKFESATLLPRNHIIPEMGVITKEPGDEPKNGLFYRTPPYSNWLIEAGKPSDLGKLLKCAPHAISKKNMAAFWDQFGELFGLPIRIAKTNTRDPKERAEAENMMENMGAAAWAVFDEGTEIEIKESNRGDAYNVYDKRIDRCNNEISKIIMGQTMTIDNGSSKSQSETHMKVLKNIIESDADMLRDVINDQIIPLCKMHGIVKQEIRFEWDKPNNYTPEQQAKIEELVLKNYEIDPQYFVDKYKIPVTGVKTKESNTKNNLRSPDINFFD